MFVKEKYSIEFESRRRKIKFRIKENNLFVCKIREEKKNQENIENLNKFTGHFILLHLKLDYTEAWTETCVNQLGQNYS